METHPHYFLLVNEAHLVNICLSKGLTQLLKVRDINSKHLYPSLFDLSIGFERMCKLVLVVDSLITKKCLSIKTMKKYGHDIKKLYSAIQEIGKRANIDFPNLWIRDKQELNKPLEEKIINMINSCSKDRYQNLNILLGSEESCSPKFFLEDIMSQTNDYPAKYGSSGFLMTGYFRNTMTQIVHKLFQMLKPFSTFLYKYSACHDNEYSIPHFDEIFHWIEVFAEKSFSMIKKKKRYP